MYREDWDYFEYRTCAEHSNIRNSQNIKEGARDLKRMEVTLKPFATCCNLLSRRKPEYFKPELYTSTYLIIMHMRDKGKRGEGKGTETINYLLYFMLKLDCVRIDFILYPLRD